MHMYVNANLLFSYNTDETPHTHSVHKEVVANWLLVTLYYYVMHDQDQITFEGTRKNLQIQI